MRPRLKSALVKIMRPIRLRSKDRIYSTGDDDNALYLVVEGEVDIRLATDKYHYKRLKRVGPGGFFGEMSFLNPGPRVTTAVALGDVKLMALDRQAAADDPLVKDAVQALQIELGYDLAARMRWASAEICRLERW